jgi:hypothetical protein
MKNLKSLQVVGLAGVAIALTAGCSSTSMRSENSSTDSNAAYRFVSSAGWAPITSSRQLNSYPQGRYWNPSDFGPVSYETYTFAVPAAGQPATTDTSVAQFNEGMQPGDVFVEAAGGPGDNRSGTTRRVILYSPFSSTGLGH